MTEPTGQRSAAGRRHRDPRDLPAFTYTRFGREPTSCPPPGQRSVARATHKDPRELPTLLSPPIARETMFGI